MFAKQPLVTPMPKIEIRDAQWLVHRVGKMETKGQALHVVGLSELVIGAPEPEKKKQPVQMTLPFTPITPDLGIVNVDNLTRDFPRLREVAKIADRQRFLHWELEFADIFKDHGGVDLMLGNPPWLKLEWNEEGILGDREPRRFSTAP